MSESFDDNQCSGSHILRVWGGDLYFQKNFVDPRTLIVILSIGPDNLENAKNQNIFNIS